MVFFWQECRQTEQGALTGEGFTDPTEGVFIERSSDSVCPMAACMFLEDSTMGREVLKAECSTLLCKVAELILVVMSDETSRNGPLLCYQTVKGRICNTHIFEAVLLSTTADVDLDPDSTCCVLRTLSKFLPPLFLLAASPVYGVRVMSSRALVAMIPPSQPEEALLDQNVEYWGAFLTALVEVMTPEEESLALPGPCPSGFEETWLQECAELLFTDLESDRGGPLLISWLCVQSACSFVTGHSVRTQLGIPIAISGADGLSLQQTLK
ncbi:hypothetical protein cypCar_00032276 [Cyprinus carpio]|nr:hypothetical protein cypCar_00032276 [Cyprinus carpio]